MNQAKRKVILVMNKGTESVKPSAVVEQPLPVALKELPPEPVVAVEAPVEVSVQLVEPVEAAVTVAEPVVISEPEAEVPKFVPPKGKKFKKDFEVGE